MLTKLCVAAVVLFGVARARSAEVVLRVETHQLRLLYWPASPRELRAK